MLPTTKRLLLAYRNVLLYAAIGVTALIVELAAFYIVHAATDSNIPLSNALAMLLGFIISFVLNAFYNFNVRNKLLSRLIRFGIITTGGYFLSTGFIVLLVNVFGAPAMFAKVLSLPLFFAFQYTLNSRFTFNDAPRAVAAEAAAEDGAR